MNLILSWVEKNESPSKTLVVDPHGRISVTKKGAGYLLCSYPNYPRYIGGPTDQVSSYMSETP